MAVERAVEVAPERTGPAALGRVMDELDEQVRSGEAAAVRPRPTGFQPLDDVLNGGIRAGELLVVGGAQGVGKPIFALQVARNLVARDPTSRALYVCYGHDRTHLHMRRLCTVCRRRLALALAFAVLVLAALLAGPPLLRPYWQNWRAQGSLETIRTRAEGAAGQLDSGVGGLLDRLYLLFYDRRAPAVAPPGVATPTIQPAGAAPRVAPAGTAPAGG